MEEEKKEIVENETPNQEEKRFIGMNKNICFGLSWLILPVAIVALAVDHAKMDEDEKQQIVSIYVLEGAAIILSTIFSILGAIVGGVEILSVILSLIQLVVMVFILVIAIMAAVRAFKKNYWQVPCLYDFAGKFLKK